MKIIHFCDLLGIEPKLQIKSNYKHSTLLGFLLTLLALLIIMGISIYFIVQTFQRGTLNVTLSQSINNTPSFILNDYPFAVSLLDQTNNPWNDNTIFNIQVLFINTTINQNKVNTERYAISLSTCRELLGYNGKYNISNFLCPNLTKQYSISGIFGDIANQTVINVYINQCVNQTNSSIICQPQSIINKYLNQVKLFVLLTDYYIDSNNVTQVHQSYVSTIYQYVSILFPKVFYFERQIIEYSTDYGFLFQSIEVEKFAQISSITEIIGSNNLIPGSFAYFVFNISRTRLHYSRSFIKIQTLIANIGGVISSIFTIAFYINYFFTQNLYFLEIANNIFNLGNREDDNRIKTDSNNVRLNK